MNRMTVAVLATFVVILLGSGFLAYFFRDQPRAAVTTPAPQPLLPRPHRPVADSRARGFRGTRATWRAAVG